ncbi:hypothetical protein ACFU5B_24945 [Streptomyces murinus]|uniref:hypothetical protein n=1 Tax=Streptomyces murinus TaxID=33900 RepID=UPI0036439CD2
MAKASAPLDAAAAAAAAAETGAPVHADAAIKARATTEADAAVHAGALVHACAAAETGAPLAARAPGPVGVAVRAGITAGAEATARMGLTAGTGITRLWPTALFLLPRAIAAGGSRPQCCPCGISWSGSGLGGTAFGAPGVPEALDTFGALRAGRPLGIIGRHGIIEPRLSRPVRLRGEVHPAGPDNRPALHRRISGRPLYGGAVSSRPVLSHPALTPHNRLRPRICPLPVELRVRPPAPLGPGR